jgi:hypothetical protein
MTATPGTSWQIMLADLSIILFLTTFSALAKGEAAPPKPAIPVAAPALAVAEPVAMWRAGKGAPPLDQWLNGQAIDNRMRINVHGGYRPGRRDAVMAEAAALSATPALAGRAIRLILEPAAADAVTVTLSFDQG